MNFLSYRSVRFFLTLILAWAVLPTFAAVSPYCPAQPLSVANGGSVTSANLASCDGPFDFGMGIVPAELPVHGTITLAAQGPASSQFVTYTHSGNSATSDTFKLEDENGDLLTFTVTITPPTSLIVVTPVSLPTLTAGTPFSQTLSSTGGTGPYTYTHTGGALPLGVTLSTGGVLSGTPMQRGGYSFSVTSQDSLGALAVKGYTGTVQNPSLSITPAVATAIQGAAFSQTLTAAGGVAPHTYLLEPPNPFPAGITVSTAGVVSGTTSAAAGNYLVTLRVTDSSTGPGSYFELETFTVTVSPPPSVSIAVTPASVSEDGATNLTFTVTRSLNLSSPTTVNITTSGTATSGVDYVGGVATVVIPANATTATITLNPTVDGVVEPDETVILTVAAGTGYTVGAPASATGTILNDDVPTATIAVSPAAVAEDGAANLVYTVTLNSASATALNINFTVGGTASNGTDYSTIASPLVIPAGSTTGTITVNPTADATNEADETVSITLAAGTGYTVGSPSSATGTIQNDDLPNLTITDVTVTEGNAGITNATFTVSLSAPAGPGGVTFDIATANGTATGGVDFVAQNSTGQTILPGSSTYTFTVLVNGDTLNEPTETFLVNVTNVTNAVLVDGQGVGTITNDDPLPMLAIIDATVTEGNSGTTNAVFTVALSAASGQTVTFNYATADGTATAPSDYASTSGSLAFTPGQTTQKIFVPVVGDAVDEANETFFVNLSGATNATIADNQGLGTITNDDTPPTISIGNVTVAEGNAGTTSAIFTVSLNGPSAQTVTVNYATADGTAVASSDYVAAAGTVTFNSGVTTQTVTVLVNGDTTFEANETFTVNLSSPTNATIVGGTGTGTITNDDSAPVLSINNASVTEGNAGTTTATFTASLSAASGLTTTVNYATANGTATAGVDYVAASGTVTFAPGQTTQAIAVTVNGDALSEANETFTVTLSAPGNATIGVGTGTGTINDDDPLPALSINGASVTEGNAGTVNAVFTVSMSAASGQSVSVGYATTNATALAGSDYVATSGTLTFTPGQTTQQIQVVVNGDIVPEANETFSVVLSAPVNATIATGTGIGTITNDDVPVAVSPTTVPSATVATPYSQTLSGSGGSGPYAFTVTAGALPAGLSLAPGGSLSGTPTAGGTFTFTATATDSSPAPGPFTGSQAYTLVVAAPTIVLPATTLTSATIGTSYSATLDAATGGTSTYSYAVTGGALPAGVSLTSATRALSGTPTQAGTFSFTVTATDSSTGTGPYTGTQTYSLVVGAPTIVVNPATLPNAQVGIAINQAITASGGTATYSYAVTAGTLPANVTLSATGALAGTPTTAGVYNFTVTATDSSTGSGSPFTGSRAYTLTIAAALPGAPAIATAVAGSAQITLTVAAPLDTGGDTITGYSATCTPTPSGAAVTATSTTTTIVVNGLANGTNYTCTASAINSAGTGAPSAPTATLSPVLTTYTGPTATSSGNATVTLTGGGSSCSFAPFGTGANESAFFIPLTGHPKSPPSTAQFPPNVRFPYGLLDFVLVGCTPGGTVSLSVTYPGSDATGAQYWKYGPMPSSAAAAWYTIPASVTGNTFTFSITDGGLGDDDLTPNGTIVDQGGPGVTAPPVPVPTNNDWLLLAFMSALLGFSAVLQSRRSNRRQLKGPVCSC